MAMPTEMSGKGCSTPKKLGTSAARPLSPPLLPGMGAPPRVAPPLKVVEGRIPTSPPSKPSALRWDMPAGLENTVSGPVAREPAPADVMATASALFSRIRKPAAQLGVASRPQARIPAKTRAPIGVREKRVICGRNGKSEKQINDL